MNSISKLFLLTILFLSGCKYYNYSFTGTSIPDYANTFYIDNFDFNKGLAPNNLGYLYTEDLSKKIIQDTHLKENKATPDLEFSGKILSYTIESVDPKNTGDGNATATRNKINLKIEIEYYDKENEENSWKKSFSHFYEFDAETSLTDIEENANNEIREKIIDDIFKAAFSNW